MILYFLNSSHLDSPCSSDRFHCHELAQPIVVSSFKIILKFTACKKLEVYNFVPTSQRGLDEKNSFFEFFCSESHHPSLMYFNPKNSVRFSKGNFIFSLILLLNGLKEKVTIFLTSQQESFHIHLFPCICSMPIIFLLILSLLVEKPHFSSATTDTMRAGFPCDMPGQKLQVTLFH